MGDADKQYEMTLESCSALRVLSSQELGQQRTAASTMLQALYLYVLCLIQADNHLAMAPQGANFDFCIHNKDHIDQSDCLPF